MDDAELLDWVFGWGGESSTRAAARIKEIMRERDAALAELAEAREALTEISRQKKTDEMETEYDVEVADFEGGYDACIDRARAFLARHAKREGTE